MKKNIYLILALLTATPSMATENNSTFFSRVLVSIGLSALVSNKAMRDVGRKHSLELNDLDEKQVLDFILRNYLREAKVKKHIPNELRGLIHGFFIDEWAIHRFNKNTGTAYDPHGFDIRGIHKKTKKRLDPRGFKQNGYYKNVNPTTGRPTKYNPQGYNIDRWNKDGLHENGSVVDDNGFKKYVSYASIALYEAIKNVDIKVVRLLLKNLDIDVNLKDNNGYTPLIWCCSKKSTSLSIAKALLAHPNIDVNSKNKYGTTPLINCCIVGDKSLDIAKSLLENPNININLKDDQYAATPLLWSCTYGNKSLKVAKSLVAHPNIHVNLGDKDGITPLIACCLQGDQSLGIAKALLAHKDIKVNLGHKYGITPLTWCCDNGDQSLGIAKALLSHKDINVNSRDKNGYTALDMIIQQIQKSMKYSWSKYEYVNLWNVLVAKGAILDKYKKEYHNLNPSNFKEPQQIYVRLIKQNPSKNCISKFIANEK